MKRKSPRPYSGDFSFNIVRHSQRYLILVLTIIFYRKSRFQGSHRGKRVINALLACIIFSILIYFKLALGGERCPFVFLLVALHAAGKNEFLPPSVFKTNTPFKACIFLTTKFLLDKIKKRLDNSVFCLGSWLLSKKARQCRRALLLLKVFPTVKLAVNYSLRGWNCR